MKRSLIVFSLILFVFGGCSDSSSSAPDLSQSSTDDEDDNNETQVPARKKRSPSDVLKFVKHQVVDREGTGLVASTYFLPSNWVVNEKLFWEYQDPAVPIRYQSIASSQDKSMAIQVFADQGRSWSTGPGGTKGYKPPTDIVDGLKYMIKVERKGRDVEYIDDKVLSHTAYPRNEQGMKGYNEVGVVKVEYEENGKMVVEEFYGQLDVTDIRTETALGSTQAIVWRASYLYSCKAPKTKIEECRKIAQTMKSSATLTKPFFNKLVQVLQLLSDQYYQSIYQAGQISKIISQTNDQMIANIDATYRQAQKANETANDRFSNYIRGVEIYSDDNGANIRLPSGYREAWVNDRDEYIVSNIGGYNPATDFSGNWRQLERDR